MRSFWNIQSILILSGLAKTAVFENGGIGSLREV